MPLEQEQAAFLLHSRPYRDHQVIVDLLTERDGKVSAITYLSKTGKSNKKGLLQPFLPLTVLLKGKGQLKNLSRVESSSRSYPLKGNYLFSGFYLNELIIRLLGEDIECEHLFLLYQESLAQLVQTQQAEQNMELVLRRFEQQLLEELGLCLDFSPVYETEHTHYYYREQEGFIPAFKPFTAAYYLQADLQAIHEQQLNSAEVLKCYKLLMRQVLGQLLGAKPLNSRKLFSK